MYDRVKVAQEERTKEYLINQAKKCKTVQARMGLNGWLIQRSKGGKLKNLLQAGYGYLIHTCTVSLCGRHTLNFWGCACPLWWMGPSYDMEAIMRNGAFGSKDRVVMAQADTLDELESRLLDKAMREYPDPFKLPNGEDVRRIYPAMFRD